MIVKYLLIIIKFVWIFVRWIKKYIIDFIKSNYEYYIFCRNNIIILLKKCVKYVIMLLSMYIGLGFDVVIAEDVVCKESCDLDNMDNKIDENQSQEKKDGYSFVTKMVVVFGIVAVITIIVWYLNRDVSAPLELEVLAPYVPLSPELSELLTSGEGIVADLVRDAINVHGWSKYSLSSSAIDDVTLCKYNLILHKNDIWLNKIAENAINGHYNYDTFILECRRNLTLCLQFGLAREIQEDMLSRFFRMAKRVIEIKGW